MSQLQIGAIEITWLHDNEFHLDGGAMFGVVPKILWSKLYPANDQNFIPMTCRPLLVRTPDAVVLIETGLGNKLHAKQIRNFGVKGPSRLHRSLADLGLSANDIDCVILTHLDFDHASGATEQSRAHPPGGPPTEGRAADHGRQPEHPGVTATFPSARYIVQNTELADALAPNLRSKNTYWRENIIPLTEQGLMEAVDGRTEIVPGIEVIHSGGHTRGHQVVRISSQGATALHLADLLPTHAHLNPLWLMAFDNFPLESLDHKLRWLEKARAEGWWLTFYHDPFMLAGRLAGGNSWSWEDGLYTKVKK